MLSSWCWQEMTSYQEDAINCILQSSNHVKNQEINERLWENAKKTTIFNTYSTQYQILRYDTISRLILPFTIMQKSGISDESSLRKRPRSLLLISNPLSQQIDIFIQNSGCVNFLTLLTPNFMQNWKNKQKQMWNLWDI